MSDETVMKEIVMRNGVTRRFRVSKPKPRLQKAGLTKDQIVQIAKSKGYFDVTLRWRDDRLRGKCIGLKKEGKLKGGKRIGHVQRFYPVKETDQ